MQIQRSGIGAVIAIVVLIVIIAVAAGAYFVVSSGGKSTTTTTGVASSSSHASSSQAASSSAATSKSATSSAITSTSAASSSMATSNQMTTSTSSSSSAMASSTTSTATTPASSTSTSSNTAMTGQTFTCTSTYATSTGTATAVDYTPQYIQLIARFSSMEFSISGTENGQTQSNTTLSYVVSSASGGIYAGTFNTTASGSGNGVGFAVDANNNTVLYVSEASYKLTGAEAKGIFDGFMAIFGLQQTYTDELQVFTGSQYFHSTGTQSMTYGTTTFPVTTYVANSLPFTINECGVSASVTAYTLEVGTPPGTSLQFITYLHFAGTSNGQTGDYTFQLVSMTVA